MERVGRFEKISYNQFLADYVNLFGTDNSLNIDHIKQIYDSITIPKRSTKGSAGYDFMTPIKIYLNPSETLTIPTGIRCQINNGWVLTCYPRSSMGFKYRMQLDNTVGIIDSDYYYSDNEGHIFIKITNDGNRIISLNQTDKFAQGIFVPFGITHDDNVMKKRNGGIGSTSINQP